MPKKFTLVLAEYEDGTGFSTDVKMEGHEDGKCDRFCDICEAILLTIQANCEAMTTTQLSGNDNGNRTTH